MHSALPPCEATRKETILDTDAQTATLGDGKVNKLAAAVSRRTWLVSIANSQENHPENCMAKCFDLEYYESMQDDNNLDLMAGQTARREVLEALKDQAVNTMQLRFHQAFRLVSAGC